MHSSDSGDQSPTGYRSLDFSGVDAPRLTHYLFRYPAKFHPPVVHSLIRAYTDEGQTILDPFCGSGTLLVAAAIEGRHATGSDVDPLAVFISRAKTHRYRPRHLHTSWNTLRPLLEELARPPIEYDERRFSDISEREYELAIYRGQLWVPAIPNLLHWFRRYVIVDLARILNSINHAQMPSTHRTFFHLMFASILRNTSNADPVPVSGLEVTAHMRARDAEGRVINPFVLFTKAVTKGIADVTAFYDAACSHSTISVLQADATSLHTRLRRPVDAVITSPPYHTAVDYYRRHQLEMYWLALTKTHADRLDLFPKYIGRARITNRDPLLQRQQELRPLSSQWYYRIRSVSHKRANAFLHYTISMSDVFGELATILRPGSSAVFVVGHSGWNGHKLPTSDLFAEIAGDTFDLIDKCWYPVTNRYMSYGRRNGADINEEYVLVFSRRS